MFCVDKRLDCLSWNTAVVSGSHMNDLRGFYPSEILSREALVEFNHVQISPSCVRECFLTKVGTSAHLSVLVDIGCLF